MELIHAANSQGLSLFMSNGVALAIGFFSLVLAVIRRRGV